MPDRRIVVALTGASGAAYALRLLSHLQALGRGIDLVVSSAGFRVLGLEVDGKRAWQEGGKASAAAFGLVDADLRVYRADDVAAPLASGTALRGGMVVIPCSMGTLARIATGVSSSLIERAADVCLKERRRLVLVPRETPLSLVHLRNMTAVTEAGAVVLPAAPGFYHGARTIDDLLDHVCAKVLDVLDVEHQVIRRWDGGGAS